jgi:hypothetical protein
MSRFVKDRYLRDTTLACQGVVFEAGGMAQRRLCEARPLKPAAALPFACGVEMESCWRPRVFSQRIRPTAGGAWAAALSRWQSGRKCL